MAAPDIIHHTLELLANKVDDLTPYVYERFYARSPAGRSLLQDKPHFVHGKMLNELIQAVVDVADGRTYLATLIETEVNNHNVWGVMAPMYEDLFVAFIDTVGDLLGDEFDAAAQQAWRTAFDALLVLIQPHAKPFVAL